jgi:hypothetical protein
MAEETSAEKLKRLRAEKAERELLQVATREASEIAALELESKFAAELGKLGVDFAMVVDPDLGESGIIVVKLGADLAFRRFVDATVAAEGLASAAEMYEFTAPAVVHPTAETYASIVRSYGGLASRTCDALASLHRVRSKKIEGKF